MSPTLLSVHALFLGNIHILTIVSRSLRFFRNKSVLFQFRVNYLHRGDRVNSINEELPTQPRASKLSKRGQMVKKPPWKVTGKSENVEFSRCEPFYWNIPVIAGRKFEGIGIPGDKFSKISFNLAMLSSFLEIVEDTVPFVTDNFWNFQTGSFGRLESFLVLARQTNLRTYVFTYR